MTNALKNVFTKLIGKYFAVINPNSQFLKVLTVVDRLSNRFFKKVIGIKTEHSLISLNVYHIYEKLE